MNKDLSLNTYKFTISDILFEITETRIGKKTGLTNTIDVIKNTKTNTKKEYKRGDLKIMLKKFNAKFVSSEKSYIFTKN